jgi:hypothetical protein
MKRTLRSVAYSIGIAIVTWLSTHAALLPVTDVSDGQGHGPDIGTPEWTNAVVHQTQTKKTFSRLTGLSVGILALPVSMILLRQRGNDLPIQPIRGSNPSG